MRGRALISAALVIAAATPSCSNGSSGGTKAGSDTGDGGSVSVGGFEAGATEAGGYEAGATMSGGSDGGGTSPGADAASSGDGSSTPVPEAGAGGACLNLDGTL